MTLSNAVAFVTGAGGGLGARIAARLAAEGADVAVGYRRNAAGAEAVCETVRAAGRHAFAVRLDHTDEAEVSAAIATVVDALGGLDILVNNAGMALGGHDIAPGDLDALTPEIWDQMMAVNVRGPYVVARAAAPHLRESRLGRIVNIGSTLGHGTWYADRAFNPSKAAVVPLTRFLAAALAPDVAVNCVCPGLMLGTGLGGEGGDYADRWREAAAMNATTSLDDVAAQVALLCQTETITGQAVVVDGGVHFH